jgi:hypothetical protein
VIAWVLENTFFSLYRLAHTFLLAVSGRNVYLFFCTAELFANLPLSGYWRGLVTIIKLPGNQIETVLQYIHQDIVRIYNLQDPHEVILFM